MLTCPFCGSPETDRIELEGRRFLVFACMFSPEVDPRSDEEGLRALLRTNFPVDSAPEYFRGICDRLHRLSVEGAGPARPPEPPSSEPTAR